MMVYFIRARALLLGAHNVLGGTRKRSEDCNLFMLIEENDESNSLGDLQSSYTDLRSSFYCRRSNFTGNIIILSVKKILNNTINKNNLPCAYVKTVFNK